jgi:predicted Abi (CAAX) family protease
MNSAVSELWTILGGALRLQPDAFVQAATLSSGWVIALAVVLIAGLSEAVGQSVVLFANKVKPARFVFSLVVNAVLFAFGYVFLVVSTWAILLLPGLTHVPFQTLGIALALSYLPIIFGFLVALPYLGYGVGWLLQTMHLVAMVLAVSAVAGVGVFSALLYVGIGWLALSVAQQTIGKPVAILGEKLLDAVAGVDVTSNEQLAVARLQPGDAPRASDGGGTSATAANVCKTPGPPHSSVWKVALGLAFMGAIGYVCAITLSPVHHAVFGWQENLPKAVQLPLNLVWISLIGILVAGFMAPLETLGWYAGWYGDDINNAAPAGEGDSEGISRFVVYLDGISQSGDRYTPDVETFLDALAPRLSKDTRLVRGVMTYSVINRPLDDDPILSWFWRFIDTARVANPSSLLGFIVNLRNVLIVAVSADTRYGPIYNFGIAQLVYDALVANGYRRGSGVPVTFIGYSGGGQMSAASAAYVSRAIDAPVEVISLGGVISGNCRVLEVEHLYHFIGDLDSVQRLGPIMFPSRWKVAVISNWNRAMRLGRLSIFGLGPVGHQVPGGMMDPELKLPDGRTALDQTLEKIDAVLAGRIEPVEDLAPKVSSNYSRYSNAAWNQPGYYPIGAPVDAARYPAVAAWIGRLILPPADRRVKGGGCWFEVHVAPRDRQEFVGKRVTLRWSDDPIVRRMVNATTRDVHFSAQAEYSSRNLGLVQPLRLEHWRLVDPLESLAGSHPVDDTIVALAGAISVEPGTDPTLRIARQPVQITGSRMGLVRFGTAAGERREAIHYNKASGTFDGPREHVVLPKPVLDAGGRTPSSDAGIEGDPLNEAGWYVYGAPGPDGAFVVQAILPRSFLAASPQRVLHSSDAARYVNKQAWSDLAAAKGSILSVALDGTEWAIGDRALLLHVYGGIGGPRGEKEASGPIYFGHFAYGSAEIVACPLSGDPIFNLLFEQIYTHNGDGLISGPLDASRYLGDRQFGWAGLRPTCNLLLKLDAFTGDFAFDRTRCGSALRWLGLQLETMAARYRIGDGAGATYAGAANNCSQDSNRALFAAVTGLATFAQSKAYADWAAANPADNERFARLIALSDGLRKALTPFGTRRRDWSDNEFNLGSAISDDPLDQIKNGIASWRALLPRIANDTIADVFFRHGAAGWVLGTCQIGNNPQIAPVTPFSL